MSKLSHLDRPIAFHRCLVRITGSIPAALMLSQAVYWSERTKDPDGWFYKTMDDWADETGMNRSELEDARRRNKSRGYIQEERRGLPAKMYYKVNTESILAALSGEYKALTLEDVLSTYQNTIKKLSKTGLMRAKKAGVQCELVDYVKILEVHGMICHLCQQPITRGPGQNPDDLSFDHVIPLAVGGTHVFFNVKPAHAKCNLQKGASYEPVGYQKADKNVPTKRSSSLTQSEQEGLHKTDITETTTETTTETNTESAPLAIFDEVFPGKRTIFSTQAIEQASISDEKGWREALERWRTNGYSLRNIAGLIDSYKTEKEKTNGRSEWQRKREEFTRSTLEAFAAQEETRRKNRERYASEGDVVYITPPTLADKLAAERRRRDECAGVSVV